MMALRAQISRPNVLQCQQCPLWRVARMGLCLLSDECVATAILPAGHDLDEASRDA